ncbi:NACHT and WD40 repeat domain-containing protein, partial [Mycoavidus cysteinexigens]
MKISAVSSFKRSVLGHDSVYYVKKGTDYLNRAEQQHHNKRFSEAQRLFGKAQHTFNKIDLSDKTDTLNHTLAQAYLEYGDRLRDCGALLEARAGYEAARVFDPALANERLQALVTPKSSLVQASVSDMVMALAIQSGKPPSLSTPIETVYFKINPAWVKADEDVSGEPKNIRNTYHLARSLRSADLSNAQELNELARNILEVFGQRDYKDLAIWREVIPLAATPDPVKCRYLIGKAHKVIATQEKLLDPSVLQSMAVMIHHLPESLFKSSTGDLVQLLKALIKRLSSEHQPGNTQSFQQLLQTTSQVLDAMAKAGVTGISRTEVQEPLDQILAGLGQEPALRFQAYYARQALAHIPNDESRWQEIWRRGSGVVVGAVTLASVVRTFNSDDLLKALDSFSEAFSGAVETVKRLAELTTELQGFGATVQETGQAIRDSLSQKRQQRWYAALQFMDTCLEERQWVQFEQIARQSEFSGNEAFLLGVCQRLEHIVRTQKEEVTQKAAITFLSDLVLNSPQYEQVQQAVYQVLSRLAKTQTVSEPIHTQAQQALDQLPATAQAQAEDAEDLYLAPVWDPAWQQVGTQLLYQARGDEHFLTQFQTTALQSNKAPLALLGKDIQKLEAQYTKSLKADEVKEALEMYTAPQGKLRVESTEHFDLEDKVNAFLQSDKKVLLLLGEGGSGKSTFNRHLARRLWTDYQHTDHAQAQPIPLFIPLATLDNPGKNLIEQYLREQGLSEAQIEALRCERRFIFILDGYDEIAHRSQAFYAGNKLERWQAQVIISSRPEYLGTNYQNKFYPPGSPSVLEECRLVGFSDQLIEKYIDKYVEYAQPQWTAEAYKRAFKDIPELKELVRTPFMLKMTLEVLPKLEGREEKSKLTRIRLYEKFVENWLNRSQDRLARIQLNPEEQKAFEKLDGEFTSHGWAYSQNLALSMYEKQLVSVTYSEAKDGEKADWRARYLGDAEETTKLLRFNAPLSRQKDQYRFIHKSIQDYLVARAVWEELESGAEFDASVRGVAWNGMKSVQCLWEKLMDSNQVDSEGLLNRFNLVEDAAIQRFLVERVEQGQGLVKQLLGWIKASAQTESVSQGAANAMTILVGAGIQFNGMNLQGIRIPGADLRGGVFDSARLQGADLSGVKLRQSWLREANLSGAQMAGVQFGECPTLKEESEVRSCSYSPDGKICAIGLKNGTISVYNTLNWEKMHTLQGHTDRVISVTYSPSGQQIASGSADYTVRLWDAHSGQPGPTLQGHTDRVISVMYSPSGQQIASGSGDHTVRLWDAHSGQPGPILQGHTDLVSSVAYSPSGQQIASGSADYTVRLWDVHTGQPGPTLQGHTEAVNSVAYSPSGQQIASGSWDHTVRLWDAYSGQPGPTLQGHTGLVSSVTYSPSGQ